MRSPKNGGRGALELGSRRSLEPREFPKWAGPRTEGVSNWAGPRIGRVTELLLGESKTSQRISPRGQKKHWSPRTAGRALELGSPTCSPNSGTVPELGEH